MNGDGIKCIVCEGVMRMVGTVPTKFGRARRYRCTCGHLAEIEEERYRFGRRPQAEALPEGIQEFA